MRKLEKLPTKTPMIGSVAIMVKKVRCACWAHARTFLLAACITCMHLVACMLAPRSCCVFSLCVPMDVSWQAPAQLGCAAAAVTSLVAFWRL